MTKEEIKEQEIIYDISVMAGHLMSIEDIVILDSRELFEYVIELKDKFINSSAYQDILRGNLNYMDGIDDFVEMELLERYKKLNK